MSEELQEKVYLGRILNPLGPEELKDHHPGYLAVDVSGRIRDYGPWDSPAQGRFGQTSQIDYKEKLILPGFIDVHLHLPQLDVRGRDGADLLNWLEQFVYPAESAFADPKVARDTARRLFQELLGNGTTCAAIYSSIHADSTDIAFQEAAQLGVRVLMGKVLMDRNACPALEEDPQRSLAESLKLWEKWDGYDGGRLHYIFSPRFAPACSEELLREVGQIAAERGPYIQTHLAETEAELHWVRKLFPQYRNYTEVYYKLGLLGPRTIAGHAIHLGQEEYSLLAQTETKVAHCPSANLFLHSGRMRLERMDQYGIGLGLGSDIGAGAGLSMFDLMRDMYYLNRISPFRAFYQATLGGACVLGLKEKIGSFAPGKEADFIVVDQERLMEPEAEPRAVLSQLIFRGDDRRIKATYVRGRRLYKDERHF